MSPSPDKTASEPGTLLSRIKTPVVLLLGFLLALGGYYFLYAQKKTTYLVGRNFRLLATMGDEVRDSVQSYAKFLESQGNEKIKGLETFNCPEKRPGSGSLIQLAKPENPIEIAVFNKGLCARLAPDQIFKPIFDPSSKGTFDRVLLARENGEVFFQSGASDLRISRLDPLIEKSGAKDSKPTDTVFAAASYRDVEIGGKKYKLFIQPVDLPIGTSFAGGAHETWLLCGLVTADKFVYKSLAVPSTLLLVILAGLLLAALSWPLVRLRLIGERQRVRVFDVLLLGICSLLGVAILTLFLLDVHAYAELQDAAEEQLRVFADQMAENITLEIKAAHLQIQELESRLPQGPPAPTFAWTDFSLVDSDGQQQLKWSGEGKTRPHLKVEDRPYFQHARDGKEMWTLSGPKGGAIGPFYLESVTARTTLQQQAVLAERVIPSLRGHYVVATLAIPMRSVIKPILPPGFEFAVIDDKGLVLFHSHPYRNNVENFFTEADEDQHLHSAVFARRGEPIHVRYFGKDYMARSQPVQDLPWTVVALRNEEQLRELNMEWVVTTALFLLLPTVPLVLALLAIAIARPGYRAPWIWPDSHRTADYSSLAALLGLYGLAFGIVIYRLSGVFQLLVLAWTLPFFALLASYVRLRGSAAAEGRRKIAVGLGFLSLFALLLWALSADAPHDAHPALDRALAVAFAVLILSTFLPLLRRPGWLRRVKESPPKPLVRTYPVAALLLLVLTVILPTVAVFKAVHRLELYSFIRYGQLKLARALDGDRTPQDLGFYGAAFFSTRAVQDQDETVPGPCDDGGPLNGPARSGEKLAGELPELLEGLLPHFSLHSTEMRELLHDRATDCSWDSHQVAETTMDLHSRGDSGPDLHLRSDFAAVLTPGLGQMGIGGLTVSVGLALLFGALLSRLVLFIARRLFLLDLLEPLWSVAEGTLAPVAGRNLFVVRKSPLSAAEVEASRLECFDLRMVEPEGEAWTNRCQELLDSGRDVLMTGFEHRLSDPAFNARKLELIDRLVELRERTVVVVSGVSPRHLLARERRDASAAAGGSPATAERWRILLSSFTLVEEGLRRPAQNGKAGSPWGEVLRWIRIRRPQELAEATDIQSPVLREEAVNDPFLLQIARGLDPLRHRMDGEQLLEELGERAEGYYFTVWESCSDDEKVVLQHLAQEGLINEKNRKVVRRLMARGLIRRDPSFRLPNESFRRFACSIPCRCQVTSLEQKAAPSAWDRFQWPFLAVLTASIAFFFATQQELLDSTLAMATGLTAGLPMVTKLMDFLGGRKSAAPK
jgi:hypothetical protein